MKTIEVNGFKIHWLTHSFFMPFAYSCLALIGPILGQKPNYPFVSLAILWIFIVYVNRRSKKNILYKSHCILEFRDSELACKLNNSVIWHVPYSRLSHIVVEPGNDSWFNPKSESTYIYTKDGYSYSIPIQICNSKSTEVCTAIQNVIA